MVHHRPTSFTITSFGGDDEGLLALLMDSTRDNGSAALPFISIVVEVEVEAPAEAELSSFPKST